MWGAIKSDLIDFISTIKEDTSKTLSNVLGETSEDATEENVLKKAVSDLSRSFSTYNTVSLQMSSSHKLIIFLLMADCVNCLTGN